MFETTVVESRVGHASRTRALTLPVSIGLHAAVITTALLANAWTLTMPDVSPAQIQALVIPTAPILPQEVKPPEPPPRTPVEPEPPAAPQTAQTQLPRLELPPSEIPKELPDLPAGTMTGPIPFGPVEWVPPGTPGNDSTGTQGPGQSGPFVAGEGGVTQPITIKRVEPIYPPILIKAHLEGFAIVECIVEADGTITSATVKTTTHELFGQAARDAVLQWKFKPGRLNGEPVPTIFELTVTFRVNH